MKPTKITIDLEITPAHIAAGKRFSVGCCPIALALKETFPEYTIEVTDEVLLVRSQKGNWLTIALTDEAMKFVHEFDRRYPVDPCTLPIKWGYPVEGASAHLYNESTEFIDREVVMT